MARNVPIRITKRDREEYARLVRNTRAKIRRTLENYNVDLSSKVDLPKIDDFETREEFNIWKEQQRSFTSRYNLEYQFVKNKYGFVATKAEIAEAERNAKRAQRIAERRKKEIEKLPFYSGEKQYGTVGQRIQMMKDPDVAGIESTVDFNFDVIQDQRHFEKRSEYLRKKADPLHFDVELKTMKDNFIDMLLKSHNSSANDLAERIKDLPPLDFYEMFLIYDGFNFKEFYTNKSTSTEAVDGQIEKMDSYIDRYYRDHVNSDLKMF